MLAVIESARDLSSRLDLPETLSLVVSRAKRLLGSQVAWLSAYDASLDGFHVLTSDGALSHGTGNMLAGRGLGIVSGFFTRHGGVDTARGAQLVRPHRHSRQLGLLRVHTVAPRSIIAWV